MTWKWTVVLPQTELTQGRATQDERPDSEHQVSKTAIIREGIEQ